MPWSESLGASTKFLSFSSAGTLGMAYFGMLDALETGLPEYDAWRQQLQGIVGTSAGSLCGLVLALGLDANARRQVLTEVMDLKRVLRRMDVSLLASEFGMDDGQGLRDGVQAILVQGGLSPHSTLGDLRRLLRIEFVCVCTDLRTSTRVCLASTTHPHVKVCDAVCASCAVPFVFCPVHIDDYVLLDGAMCCELADDVFPKSQTLFVQISYEHPVQDLRDWSSFLLSISRCNSELQKPKVSAVSTSERGLRLFVPSSVTSTVFDIHLDDTTKHALVHTGFVLTLEHLLGCNLRKALARVVSAYMELALVRPFNEDEQPPDDALEGSCAPSAK